MFDFLKGLMPSRRPATPGAIGEDAAAIYLKSLRYKILNRNLSNKLGEIDVLALTPDGKTLVIVEVKAATAEAGGPAPELRVGRTKQRKLTALGMKLMQQHKLEGKFLRFDVIGITLYNDRQPDIRHYPGAFESVWT